MIQEAINDVMSNDAIVSSPQNLLEIALPESLPNSMYCACFFVRAEKNLTYLKETRHA